MEVSHQPDCEGPDNHSATFKTSLFIPPSKKCQSKVSNNCCNPGDGNRRGQKLTVQGYSLNIWPFSSWCLHLTFITFCYWWPSIHTPIYLGHSTSVGKSVRSEGTRNKTLLCICQAVPATLPSQPFSGYIRIESGNQLEQGHGPGGAASSLKIP